MPGADLQGVHFLRTLADVERIMSDLRQRRRLVIVGGGYIGLEVAATCAGLGIDVTVLEMADRVMSRVTCAAVSDFFAREHARRGVRLVCNTRVYALSAHAGTGRVGSVICEDGAEYPADLVVVDVGVTPAEEIAAAAGLECGNGIVVDECGRTADPSIYAAGDCANQPSLRYGRRLRLESINNAFEQGESAALAILGAPVPHDNVPWFWSEQFDLKLVIVGLCHEYDAIVMRGSPAARCFSACYLRCGELVAIDTVGSPRDQLAARKLIAARARPRLERLADANIALRDCA